MVTLQNSKNLVPIEFNLANQFKEFLKVSEKIELRGRWKYIPQKNYHDSNAVVERR